MSDNPTCLCIGYDRRDCASAEPCSPPEPQAVAMGDQMHAAMVDQAKASVAAVFAAEGIHPSEDDELNIEIGIGAGIHAAMRVLVDMGLLAAVER